MPATPSGGRHTLCVLAIGATFAIGRAGPRRPPGAVLLLVGNGAGLDIAAIAIIMLFGFLISGAWLLMIGIYEDDAK